MLLSPPASSTDETLIERAAARDADAVGELYDRFHRRVRVLALRLLGDDMLAEDVVHDVFVGLPTALARFEGRSSLSTFILSITVNVARKKIRSSVRRRAALSRLASEPDRVGPEDPERQHRQRELAEQLQRALSALPDPQREAFVLCVVEERDSAEVAEILGVPRGTVRTRLMHAKRALRGMLTKRGVRAGDA
ncbi:MAG: RNA polymerase sigma factor [Sandaracinaceae bacterium]